MRIWGIRIAIVTTAMAMNILEWMAEGTFLPEWTDTAGLGVHPTLLRELIHGFLTGVVICLVHWAFRRSYEKRLTVAVDELNHHVRNAVQMIVNQQVVCPHCDPATLTKTVQRVDWALREVLPPEIQPRRAPEIPSRPPQPVGQIPETKRYREG